MTPSLAVPPLIEVRNPSFAHSYRQGMHWIRFEQNDHHGPFSDSDVVETLKHFLQTGIFDEEREITLYESLGSYFIGRLSGHVFSWTQEEHHRCEHDCIQELGYICALSKTCLVAVMGIPTLPLLGEQS